MLFLVVSTPRPERPSELARTRQSFWPWIAGYQARGVCRHVYARAGRGAVAVLDVEDNDALHRILNEWADIVPGTSILFRSSRLMRRSACWRPKPLRPAGEPPRVALQATLYD
jgi:muconolactone delta-isomerase